MFSISSKSLRALCVTFSVSMAAPSVVLAAEQENPRNFTEKTIEVFKKIGPLAEQKNYAAVVELLNGAIATAAPTSYDMAFLSNIKAKSLAAQEKYGEALGPWETALKLGDQFNYFDEKDKLEMLMFLAQLSYQESTNTKITPAQQKEHVAKAMGYLKRWLSQTKKVTPEASMLYASMLYNEAIADPAKPDKELLKQMRT